MYNTRDERYRLDKELNGKYFVWDTKSKDYPFDKTRNRHYFFGKVLFKFRCYKVEEISYNYRSDFTSVYTDTLDTEDLEKQACLTRNEFAKYLKGNYGCAIHISDLEIFDKPKELSEFYKFGFGKALEDELNGLKEPPYPLSCRLIEKQYQLTKAPQSFMFIESEK